VENLQEEVFKIWVRSSKKFDLTNLSEVEVFKLVLAGKISRFPKFFWEDEEAKIYSPLIVRYLIENILNWDNDDILQKLRKQTFYDNKLGGMIVIIYDSSPYKAINSAYPEREYKPFDFCNAPNNYWQGDIGRSNAIKWTKWLIEEKLKWSKTDIREKINHKVFVDNNLHGMLKKAFNTSLWECIEATYPNEFQIFEIGEHVPNNYWDMDKAIKATKWLIQTKLNWTEEDVKNNLDKQVFIDNDLYGMIQRCFNSSPYLAINTAYPTRYNPWDLNKSPFGFNSLESGANATKWLIEEKLAFTENDIREKLSATTFKNNGLNMFVEKFSVYELVNSTYPDKYMPWELKAYSTIGFWNKVTATEATRWLVETKLKCTPQDAKALPKSIFIDNRLSGVLKWFNCPVKDVIDMVYGSPRAGVID